MIFKELTLADLQDQLSNITRNFRKDRNRIKGGESTIAKAIDFERPDRFIFLTEPTNSFNTKVVNSNTFDLQQSNAYTMELQVLDMQEFKKDDYLSLGDQSLREILSDSKIRVWCDCASFHFQGFNYKLSRKNASIHPTQIKPEIWGLYHPGEIVICKHLGGLLNSLMFFVPAMLNKLRSRTLGENLTNNVKYLKRGEKMAEQDDEIAKNQKYFENMIQSLKDEKFGNKEQRQKFASMIFELCQSGDPMAKKVIKYLGDMMTDYDQGAYEPKFDSESKESENELDKKNESIRLWTPLFEESAYQIT